MEVYLYKNVNLALSKLQRLICNKTQTTIIYLNQRVDLGVKATMMDSTLLIARELEFHHQNQFSNIWYQIF